MKAKASSLLVVDRFFYLPCRLMEFAFESFAKESTTEDGIVVAIKLFGKGSLIHLAALGRQSNSETDNFFLITSEDQSEVCKWMGLTHVIYIRTSNAFSLLADCFATIRELRRQKVRTVVSLERCSYAANTFSLLLSLLTESKNIFFEASRNFYTRKRSVYAAQQLSIEAIFKKCLDELPLLKSENTGCEVEVDRQKIIININASDLLLARRYPKDKFAEVIRQLHHLKPDLKFFLTGSTSEHDYNQSVVEQLDGIDTHNVAGQWTLEELAAEMSSAAFLLTGDSMPLHLAAFLETPVVVLWGPTQPEHFGYERAKNIFSITQKLPCSPCFIHPMSKPLKDCGGKIYCLSHLKSREVTTICKSLLDQAGGTRWVRFPVATTKSKSEIE